MSDKPITDEKLVGTILLTTELAWKIATTSLASMPSYSLAEQTADEIRDAIVGAAKPVVADLLARLRAEQEAREKAERERDAAKHQLAGQIAGHALTAKQATREMLRAEAAESRIAALEASFDARVQEMSETFRAVNVGRAIEMFPGQFKQAERIAAIEAEATRLREALKPFLPAYLAYVETMQNFIVNGDTSAERSFSKGEREDEANERAFEALARVTFANLAAVNTALQSPRPNTEQEG